MRTKLFNKLFLTVFLLYGFSTVFALNYSISVSPEEGGTTIPAAGSQEANVNEKFPIKAIPAAGYKFVRWSIYPTCNCTGTIEDHYSAETNAMIFGRVAITAVFNPDDSVDVHSLTLDVSSVIAGTTDPEHGSHDVVDGAATTIKAIPSDGYTFSGWSVSPEDYVTIADTSAAETTVVLTGDATVTANFTANLTDNLDVTVGSRFYIEAKDLGITEFSLKPKVYLTGGVLNDKKKMLKVLNTSREFRTGGVEKITCEIKRKLEADTYDLYIILGPKRENIISIGEIIINGPGSTSLLPNTGETGTEVTLNGRFFGVRKIKLWFSYKDKRSEKQRKVRCRIQKPYAYPEYKGSMDPFTGKSQVVFTVPKGITTTTECLLNLKTQVGMFQIPFNSEGDGVDITPENAVLLINANEGSSDFVILDVRTADEFAESHIKNAVNLNYYSATFNEDLDNLDKNMVYLVYCGVGGRSEKATDKMAELGFTQYYNLLGGITAFKETAPELIVTGD